MTLKSGTDYKAICFVDMPFGKKPDLAGGVVIDFDVNKYKWVTYIDGITL
jgi:hypothetical protein